MARTSEGRGLDMKDVVAVQTRYRSDADTSQSTNYPWTSAFTQKVSKLLIRPMFHHLL